jgi:hypothetical protein
MTPTTETEAAYWFVGISTILGICLMITISWVYEKNEKVRHVSRSLRTLNGIFEIHITVHPKNDYTKLLKYVNDRKHERKFKLVFAVSGTNNQYMLSYFTRKDNEDVAIKSAKDTAKDLEKNDISVARIKVECHDVSNLPVTDNEYEEMKNYLIQKYNNKCGKPYFEFHCKISTNYYIDLDELEQVVKCYDKCAISYNLCGFSKNPILTIRIYDVGFANAEKCKDTIMNGLKKSGYIFEDKIQTEFSVFDSNPQLDAGFITYS